MTVVVVGGTWGQISLSEENVPQHFINILCPEEGRQAETLTISYCYFVTFLSIRQLKPIFKRKFSCSSLNSTIQEFKITV